MLKFIAKRLLRLIWTLFAVTFITFVLTDLLPGDPITQILPPESLSDLDLVAQIEEELGLNDPLLTRYVRWVGNAMQGDFGRSFGSDQTVMSTIKSRLPVTAELALVTVIFSLIIAVPMGTLAAYRQGKSLDQVSSSVFQIFLSIPSFVVGIFCIWLFALKLGWVPASGWNRLGNGIWPNMKTVFMPALSLSLAEMAVYARVMRSDMISTLQQDFILSARAKGLRDRYVLSQHALRPSSLSLVTIVGLNLANLLAGAVVVERLFAIPGLGFELVESILNRDYLLILGLVSFIGIIYVLLNTLVDLIYMFVDPRIREAL